MPKSFIFICLIFLSSIKIKAVPLPDSLKITSVEQLISVSSSDSVKAVTKLNMDGLFCGGIPDELAKFTNLQELMLNVNQLDSIPEYIGLFKQLKSLELGSNNGFDLECLFNILSNNPEIEKLYLYNNNISSIPSNIYKLKNLRILDLGGNEIRALPSEIDSLHYLQSLDLSNNPIEFDTISTAFCNLKSLKRLNLYNCGISNWPKHLECLANIEELIINNNDLTTIPKDISYLKKLKFLLIVDNKLNSIDETITELNNLSIILLQGNYGLNQERIEHLKSKMPKCKIIY
ncbi:MAG: leucine-rich repeat domain-containing protein [Clostridiales bacterium]